MASKRPKKGNDAFFGISAYQAGNRDMSPVTGHRRHSALTTTIANDDKMDRRDGEDKGWGSRREPQVRVLGSI
jgi:hypothetical protein